MMSSSGGSRSLPAPAPWRTCSSDSSRTGFFPERLDAYANTVRKLGNVGTHNFSERDLGGGRVPVAHPTHADPRMVLRGRAPEAGRETRPSARARHEAEPDAGAGQDAQSSVAVVPKGLRSFDANDSDFFLQLLPGPRDKDGLPESIRFWKHRIEASDDRPSPWGSIYGPSGCGKSSLVKAGLLPRLAKRDRLRLRRGDPRRDRGPASERARRKLATCLPTWISSRRSAPPAGARSDAPTRRSSSSSTSSSSGSTPTGASRTPELAQALRQCDGDHVQCVVMVRDDFWVALTRFMGELGIELLQGQNTALVDLFDPIHARKVLAAFGRSYGDLPASPESPTGDQDDLPCTGPSKGFRRTAG